MNILKKIRDRLFKLPNSMFLLVLEVFAGILFLFALMIGGGFWWFNQPENQAFLRQEITEVINSRLAPDQKLTFEDLELNLSMEPLGAQVRLLDVQFFQPNQEFYAPSVALDYPLSAELIWRRLPRVISIDGLKVWSHNNQNNQDSQDANITASTEQVSGAAMLWFAPDMLPDAKISTIFTGIAEVHLNNFSAIVDQHHIKGDLELYRRGDKGLVFTGTFGDALEETTGDEIQGRLEFLVPYLEEEIQTNFTGHIGDEYFLDGMRFSGGKAETQINARLGIKDLQDVLDDIAAKRDLATILKPFTITASMDWQDPDSLLVLEADKTRDSAIDFTLHNTALFTLPLGLSLPLVEGLNLKTFPQKISELRLEATLDLPLQQVLLHRGKITFAQGGQIEASGLYQYSAQSVDMDVSLKDWPHTMMPSLSEGVWPQSGTVDRAEGKVTFADGQISVQDVHAKASDIRLTIEGETLHIPALVAEVPSLKQLHLKASEPIFYGDIRMGKAELHGNPEGNLQGEGLVMLPPKAALAYLPNPYGKMLALDDEVTLQAKFSLNGQPRSFRLDQLNASAAISGRVLNRPIRIEQLQYTPQKVTLSGIFSDALFTASSSDKGREQIYRLKFPALPATEARSLLEEHDFLPQDFDFQVDGSLDLELQAVLEAGNTTLHVDSLLDDFGMESAEFGQLKKRGTKGQLSLKAHEDEGIWHVDLAGEMPKIGGKLAVLYDAASGTVRRISESVIRYQNQSVKLNAERTEKGLDIRLKSKDLADGAALIARLKQQQEDGLSDGIPEFLSPMHTLEWAFSEGVQIDDVGLGGGVVAVGFQDQKLNSVRFRFEESEPVQIYQVNTQDQARVLQPSSIAQHELDYVAGQKLRLLSPNAGKLFSALDVTKSIIGGEFTIDLAAKDAELIGDVALKNFAVLNASGAVNFLQAISLTGLLPLLSNEGLPFYALNAEVSGKDSLWQLKDLKAYGPGLSMTFDGAFDVDAKTIEGNGAASPTSILNNVLVNIPLFGPLLTGTDGGGLVAVNYTVSGDIQDPKTSAQPLSLLTPGILRNIFGGLAQSP